MGRKTEQHQYFTQEKWNKVNSINKELFNDFIDYMKASDKSPQTINTYINSIQIFLIWCLDNLNNKFFTDLTKKDIMKFQNYLLNTQNLSPARIRFIRSSLSSWGNYIENFEDEIYPNYRNIINKVSAPPLEKIREKTYLTEEQINELLIKLVEREKWQQALYVAISFASGARKAEVAQFKVEDFKSSNLKNGLYKTSPIRCKGRGRIGKMRNLFVPSNLVQEWLNKWYEIREKLNIESEYLFVTKSKDGNWNQINPHTFNKWCEFFSKLMNIDIFPHAFRASIASHLKAQSKDITSIQKLLGHNDISTTQIYLKPTDEEDIEDLFN